MIILYNLLLIIPLIFSIPITFFLLNKDEFLQRYGFKIPKTKNPIWFHCASLGELNGIKPLIKELSAIYPDEEILITTTSRTGLKEAKRITDLATFLPIDHFFIIKRFLKIINPKILIITETEIWPNLFYLTQKIIIVNGRLSQKHLKKYKMLKILFPKLFENVIQVCVQSETDNKRYQKIGLKNLTTTGNLKFSVTQKETDKIQKRTEWGYSPNDFIIVWGSSRPGEEKLIADLFPTLKEKIPKLKLIIAPRHLKRLSEVKQIFHNYSLYSQLKDNSDNDILIIDTMGILTQAYAVSDIAVIGGSFYNFGGHNPLEAIFYKIPTIIGNYHSSCEDTVNILLKGKGIIVSNEKNLINDIIFLYENPQKRISLGENGYKVMKKNSQSLPITLNCIKKALG